MTQLLQKAFDEVNRLSEKDQNRFAQWLLDELTSESRWEKSFAESEPVLSQLAEEALDENEKGLTKLLSSEKM